MTYSRRQVLKALAILPICRFLKPDLAKANATSHFRFAFGSCNRQWISQDFWHHIADKNPELWLGLGDNIYADLAPKKVREEAYNHVKSQPGFQRLLKTARFNATWDDHDYGFNGAGAEFPDKKASQDAFLDFVGEPTQSPRRRQKGIYTSVVQGDVEFLLLDLRYFKPLRMFGDNLLGSKQWEWVSERFQNSTAKLIVLCSSFQFLPDMDVKESWQRFAESRTQMLNLIEDANRPVMILSGDRHFYEVSQTQLRNGRILVEVTSSGLTHVSNQVNSNSFRVGEVLYQKNFCVMDFEITQESIQVTATGCDPDSGKELRVDRWTHAV